MGDISIIARRLSENYVQYGWSGNGGYFSAVGARLLYWYDNPAIVDYLFGLGQLELLWEPYTEEDNRILRMRPTGEPHWVDHSERDIFSRIAFIDYGYLYDSDNRWYYVTPDPFRLKMPLEFIENHLNEEKFEFDFLKKLRWQVLEKIIEMCCTDSEIKERLKGTKYTTDSALDAVMEELKPPTPMPDIYNPLMQLWDNHNPIYDAFDDWVLIRTDEDHQNVTEIVLKPKTEEHIETIFW